MRRGPAEAGHYIRKRFGNGSDIQGRGTARHDEPGSARAAQARSRNRAEERLEHDRGGCRALFRRAARATAKHLPSRRRHVYIAILTDTGAFHYSNITPRTFDICRRCVEAGVNPPAVARSIFDSNNLARLKLYGAVLHKMQLDPSGRIATVYVDQQLARECGGTYDDTEGLVNLPLTVKDIVAVAFFKENGPGDWRLSMRSKGNINVNAIAREFGGGGHTNASGCSVRGDFAELKVLFEEKLAKAIELAK